MPASAWRFAMSEHAALAWLIVLQTIIGGVCVIILGLQLREARQETARLFTATAGMVHQEAEKILAAMQHR
jgi:hypothetical protein